MDPAGLLCPWGFSRQEYRSGLPFPSLGDLPGPGIEPPSPALAGGFLATEPPAKPYLTTCLPGNSCPFLFCFVVYHEDNLFLHQVRSDHS